MTTIWRKLYHWMDGLDPNMSRTERYVRVLFGAFALGLVFVAPTPWGWLGLYPLLTGALGVCPVYRLLGIVGRQVDG